MPDIAKRPIRHPEFEPYVHAFGATAISQSNVPPSRPGACKPASIVTRDKDRLLLFFVIDVRERLTLCSIRALDVDAVEHFFNVSDEIGGVLQVVVL